MVTLKKSVGGFYQAWTDAPFRALKDPPFDPAPMRMCFIQDWDGDRFARVGLATSKRQKQSAQGIVPVSKVYTTRAGGTLFPMENVTLTQELYDYPSPAVTVDGVVFGLSDDLNDLLLLLIKRKHDPFEGCWAIPGGFVDDMDEDLDEAVRRELEEETKTTGIFLEQLYTFGAPRRDPRMRVVSIAYYALVKASKLDPQPGSDAKEAQWFKISELPELAFDHQKIIDTALQRLRAKVKYQPIGFELLSEEFTLGELQAMYEAILGRTLDKRNFRKKIENLTILKPLDKYGGKRRARLYRFNVEAYERLVKSGYYFEVTR